MYYNKLNIHLDGMRDWMLWFSIELSETEQQLKLFQI